MSSFIATADDDAGSGGVESFTKAVDAAAAEVQSLLAGLVSSLQGEVVKAIKAAYDDADINIPFPITTLDGTDDVAEAMRAIAGNGRSAVGGNGGGPSRSGRRTAGSGGSRRRVVRRSDDS